MRPTTVLLSGPIGSGKSTLSRGLRERYNAVVVSTRQLLEDHAGAKQGRTALQRLGDKLDRTTDGRWLVDDVARRTADVNLMIIDSVRKPEQVVAFRAVYPTGLLHVHLTAPMSELEARHARRRKQVLGEPSSYAEVRKNRTEYQIERLARDADIVVDTARNRPEDVLVRVAARLGFDGPRHEAQVDVLIGGQYGSEGKGNVAAYLAPEYDLLVRSGGPNAGHSVMNDDGRHVQYHLPSGATVSAARLVLTAGAVINVEKLIDEIALSDVDYKRLTIDPRAVVITDKHRTSEEDLRSAIGSTGQGVGMATAGRIIDRGGGCILAEQVEELRPYLRDSLELLHEVMCSGERVFIEGTQGSGLSLLHGPYPHVTSRDTNASGVLAEAGVPPHKVRKVIMVVRTYPIMVANPVGGTSGPMSTEITWQEVANRSGLPLEPLLAQEHTSTTHRLRRVSEFDWELLRRSTVLNGPTDIALTFTDQIDKQNLDARRFDQLTDPTIQLINEIELVTGAPVSLISTRFHRRSIIDRRSW
jgi:adenylosuccinate synthase